MNITMKYLDRINGPEDLKKLDVEQLAELADETSSFDPLAEERYKVTERLVHRYRDRVLLLTTGRCFLRCRFCLRKRFWNGTDNSLPDITEKQIEDAYNYIHSAYWGF